MKPSKSGKVPFLWLMGGVLALAVSCSRNITVTSSLVNSTPTNTSTFIPALTATPTYTFTNTFTFTSTNTLTFTTTSTPLYTPTFTLTDTNTSTCTSTVTPTSTATSTFTNTSTNTPTPNVGVHTLAGTLSTWGYADGNPGTFRNPVAVAVDSSGVIYVADQFYSTIRKITPANALTAGSVTTLAGGNGTVPPGRGYTDATGTAAAFNLPSGIAVDSSGNIYVADSGNNVIREITAAGAVSTLAGQLSGASGSTDATGTAASFNFPSGVALNSAGTTLYVADTSNQLIRAITLPGAAVTTVAGTAGAPGTINGAGTAAKFANPNAVAVDASGNIYVADTANNMIRAITPGGVVSTLAGQTSPGYTNNTGAAAQFNQPFGISVDSATGNLYVADYTNNAIRKITPGGIVTTWAGSLVGSPGCTDAAASSALFSGPAGLAVDTAISPIIIYVADKNCVEIRSVQ